MLELTEYCPRSIHPPFLIIWVNASRGLNSSTPDHKIKSHFQSTEDELKQKKELHLQKRAKQREQLEKQSVTNVEYLKALNVKKCMLEIQSVMLERLAAEENHLKGLAVVLRLILLSFDEWVKEVEKALTMLKY